MSIEWIKETDEKGRAMKRVEMEQIEREATDLLEILEHEKNDYDNLLQYSYKKQKVLLANDIDGLISITEDENNLIHKIQQMEKKRLWLLNNLAADFHISVDELNLKRLAELVSPDLSDRFVNIGEELRLLLEELSSVNRVNSKLIMDSLTFTTCILDVLTQQDRKKSTYKEKGQKEQRELSIAVDRRA